MYRNNLFEFFFSIYKEKQKRNGKSSAISSGHFKRRVSLQVLKYRLETRTNVDKCIQQYINIINILMRIYGGLQKQIL